MGFNAFQWGKAFCMTTISLNSDFPGTDYRHHAGHHCIISVHGFIILIGCAWCFWIIIVIYLPSVIENILKQWSPTLGLQMFLDFNSQKSWPAEVVVKASGSCSPRTSGGPRLGSTWDRVEAGFKFLFSHGNSLRHGFGKTTQIHYSTVSYLESPIRFATNWL